jgi:hypothetical protein
MAEHVTRTPPVGELIITSKKTHGVFHVLVVPHSAPNDWFFKQFPLREQIDEFALEHNFSVRVEGEDASTDEG